MVVGGGGGGGRGCGCVGSSTLPSCTSGTPTPELPYNGRWWDGGYLQFGAFRIRQPHTVFLRLGFVVGLGREVPNPSAERSRCLRTMQDMISEPSVFGGLLNYGMAKVRQEQLGCVHPIFAWCLTSDACKPGSGGFIR